MAHGRDLRRAIDRLVADLTRIAERAIAIEIERAIALAIDPIERNQKSSAKARREQAKVEARAAREQRAAERAQRQAERQAEREAEKQGTLVTSSIEFPQDVRTMFEDVFEDMPWHLREQQEQMVAELEAKRK